MASEALLRIKVIADTAGAAIGLDKASGKFGKFGSAMKRAAVPAAAIVGAIGLGAKAAIDAASDYQQAQGAVEAVFGHQAKAVEALSKTSADRLGLAGSEYMNYAALVGGALQNAGFSTQQAVGKQDKLLTRAADLAATYGGTTADAVDAINAAISRSEFDPLEKFNVSLNMTAINAELAKRGQDKLTGAALAHAKAQVIMEQIYKKSGKAAGQFADESDTAAGQQQRAAAAAKDAAATMGAALLPAYTKAMQLLAQFAKWAAKNKTVVLVVAAALGVLAIAVLAVNAAMWLLALNPVTLAILAAVAAVAVLAVAFVILYKKSETFRRIVDYVWKATKLGAQLTARAIGTAFGATWRFVSAAARGTAGVVRAVVNAIRAVVSAVTGFIRAAFSNAWRVVSAAARGAAAGVRGVLSGIRGAASAAASYVRARFADAWNAVKSAARAVSGVISAAMGAIKSAVGRAVSAVQSLGNWLGRIHPPGAVASAFESIRGAINGAIGAVQSLIGWLSRIHVPHISLPGGKSGKAVSPAVAARHAVAPGVSGRAGTMPAPTTSGGVTIQITGALDPEGVARQVQRLLTNHDRRVGLVRA